MTREILISPSMLAADVSCLGQQAMQAQIAGADWLHVDIMDGHFVPNFSYGPDVVRMLKKKVDLPLDVHLMLEQPWKYVDIFLSAGSDILVFPVETGGEKTIEMLKKIKERGSIPGLAINPPTPIETIYPFLPYVELVTIMGVMPGFGGQAMDKGTMQKVETLRKIAPIHLDIEVDGGLRMENAGELRQAGANVLVAGTAVFCASDMKAAIATLRGTA